MRLEKPQGERRRGQKTILPLAEREAFSEALETRSGQFSLKVVFGPALLSFPSPPAQERKPEVLRELRCYSWPQCAREVL